MEVPIAVAPKFITLISSQTLVSLIISRLITEAYELKD